MASVPVTFEGSGKIDQIKAEPFILLKRASENQFEKQAITIPATDQEFQTYENYMSHPFNLQDFKYQFLLVGDYLQDERLDSLVDFIRQQILSGQIRLPSDLPQESLEILFRELTRKYTPGELGVLLEQENFHSNWSRLYPYFPIRATPGLAWEIPLLSVTYQIEDFHLVETELETDQDWSDLTTFKVEYWDWALIHGLIQVVDYLIDTFEIDIRSDQNYALKMVARYGQLNLLIHLDRHFSLTTEDVRTNNNNRPLILAARCGHLEVVQYLVEKFGLTENDLRGEYRDYPALVEAALYNHLKIVKYLVEYFNLTRFDLYGLINGLLVTVALKGQLEMFQYIIEYLKWDLGNFRDVMHLVITNSAARGYLEIIRYVFDHFDVYRSDVRDFIIQTVHEAQEHGHQEIIEYLRQRFI